MIQNKPLNLAYVGIATAVIAVIAGLFYGYEKTLNAHEMEQFEEHRLVEAGRKVRSVTDRCDGSGHLLKAGVPGEGLNHIEVRRVRANDPN